MADAECRALCEGPYDYEGYNYLEYNADLFQAITGGSRACCVPSQELGTIPGGWWSPKRSPKTWGGGGSPKRTNPILGFTRRSGASKWQEVFTRAQHWG